MFCALKPIWAVRRHSSHKIETPAVVNAVWEPVVWCGTHSSKPEYSIAVLAIQQIHIELSIIDVA